MRFKRGLAGLAMAAAILAAPMSAEAGFFKGVGTYFQDRGNDLLDVFRLRVGAPANGRAIGAKARATSLVQAGYVSFEGTYVGLDRRGVGIVDERRRESGVSLLYGSFNEMEPRWGNGFLKANTEWSKAQDRRILRNLPHWDDGRRRPLSLGAELALPIFAIDVGLYPEELLDFATGWLAIDLFADDQLLGQRAPKTRATTPAVPVTDAPFADKRREHEAFRAEMERKAAEEALRAAEATNAANAAAGSVPLRLEQEAPATAAPPEPAAAPAQPTITGSQADAAMRALDTAPAPEPTVESPAPESPAEPVADPDQESPEPG